MEEKPLAFRSIGYILSLLLTIAAFILIIQRDLFHLSKPAAIVGILVLAVLQGAVQFIFFLNVWREKGVPWNLGVFISTVSILLIIVIFSIWIMHHLDTNMMP